MPNLNRAVQSLSPKQNRTPKGSVGYDNPRENIDPHIKTKVVSTKEISAANIITKNAMVTKDIYMSGDKTAAFSYKYGDTVFMFSGGIGLAMAGPLEFYSNTGPEGGGQWGPQFTMLADGRIEFDTHVGTTRKVMFSCRDGASFRKEPWDPEAICKTDNITAERVFQFPNMPGTIIVSGSHVAHDDLVTGTIATHDTSATGAELDTLTDGSNSDALHVHEGAAIKSTGEGGATKFLREDGDGTCSWQAAGAGGGDVTAAANLDANTILVGDDGAKGIKDSSVVIDANGQIGVGIAVPINPIHVSKDQNAYTTVRIENETDGTTANATLFCQGPNDGTVYDNIAFLGNYSSSFTLVPAWAGVGLMGYSEGDWVISAYKNTGRIVFQTGGSGEVNKHVFIDETGDVGLGTAPAVLLHLKDVAPKMRLEDTGNTVFEVVNYNDEFYLRDVTNANKTPIRVGANSNTGSFNITSTEVVINEGSNDVNFRVEGATDVNLLFCDAGAENVGIGVADPHSKLEVAGAISSATATMTDTQTNIDVSGINTLFVNITTNKTLSGMTGGVDGQHIEIVYIGNYTAQLLLSHLAGAGDQDLHMHSGADETIDGGGMTFACNGTTWYDCGHGKHV